MFTVTIAMGVEGTSMSIVAEMCPQVTLGAVALTLTEVTSRLGIIVSYIK